MEENDQKIEDIEYEVIQELLYSLEFEVKLSWKSILIRVNHKLIRIKLEQN